MKCDVQIGGPGAEVSPVCDMKFGSDVICTGPDSLVILAAQPMDWQVREFCRVPIFVEGRKYFLRSKSKAGPPFAMRYELCPWPQTLHNESPVVVHYTKHFIAERDRAAAAARRGDVVNLLLLPFYPLLGLCWSSFKRGPLRRAGFESSSITKASVVMLFHLWVVEGIFVGWLRGGLFMLVFSSSKLQWLDWLFMLMLTLDTLVRASGAMRLGTGYHLGFCEWLVPGRNKADE
jgi:hypothetical protein